MPTDVDSTLLEIFRNAPVREREDWRVKVTYQRGLVRYWNGYGWEIDPTRAAHFFDIHTAVRVVGMLESFIPRNMGSIQAEPVEEG